MTKNDGFNAAVSEFLGGNTSILPTRLEPGSWVLRNNVVGFA
ncbi:hypothetical protein [Acaryochloris sp. 'Moss Beach']|nr:hypothetical protein [Acaryochloris sp. 'Moss Beach']